MLLTPGCTLLYPWYLSRQCCVKQLSASWKMIDRNGTPFPSCLVTCESNQSAVDKVCVMQCAIIYVASPPDSYRAILSPDKTCDRTAILRRQQIARVNSWRFYKLIRTSRPATANRACEQMAIFSTNTDLPACKYHIYITADSTVSAF